MSDREAAKLAVFEGKHIRKTFHKGALWFVVEDVVLALIDTKDPKQYIQRMKRRDPELGKGWVQIVHTLAIPSLIPTGVQFVPHLNYPKDCWYRIKKRKKVSGIELSTTCRQLKLESA